MFSTKRFIYWTTRNSIALDSGETHQQVIKLKQSDENRGLALKTLKRNPVLYRFLVLFHAYDFFPSDAPVPFRFAKK